MDLAQLIEKIDDGANPVVVRELRQAMAGRLLPAIVLIFLATELLILYRFLLGDGAYPADYIGMAALGWLFAALLFASLLLCLFFADRFAAERADGDLELVCITTLGARRILRGKLAATLIVLLILYLCALPFMMVTHLLRGVDVPSILLTLAITFPLLGLYAAFALSISAHARSGFGRCVAGGVNAVFLPIAWFVIQSFGWIALYAEPLAFLFAALVMMVLFCAIPCAVTFVCYTIAADSLEPTRQGNRVRLHPVQPATQRASGSPGSPAGPRPGPKEPRHAPA